MQEIEKIHLPINLLKTKFNRLAQTLHRSMKKEYPDDLINYNKSLKASQKIKTTKFLYSVYIWNKFKLVIM